jgi:hypothetical protein
VAFVDAVIFLLRHDTPLTSAGLCRVVPRFFRWPLVHSHLKNRAAHLAWVESGVDSGTRGLYFRFKIQGLESGPLAVLCIMTSSRKLRRFCIQYHSVIHVCKISRCGGGAVLELRGWVGLGVEGGWWWWWWCCCCCMMVCGLTVRWPLDKCQTHFSELFLFVCLFES